MNNELKLRAVMAHPNAPMLCKDGVVRTIYGIWTRSEQPLVLTASNSYNVNDIQMELRSPSSLTDEECIDVAKIILAKDSEWKPFTINKYPPYIDIVIKVEPDITDEETEVTMVIRIWEDCRIHWTWEYKKGNGIGVRENNVPRVLAAYDYLRSINIVTEFMGVNLIEAGWAIIQP